MSIKFTYRAKDKLKSRKQTQQVFAKGSAITIFPIRILYVINSISAIEPVAAPVQIGVSAPTRYFRKAVERNRVKRLLREAVRLEKNIFNEHLPSDKHLSLFVIYIDKTILSQEEIKEKVKQSFNKLAQRIHD